MSEEIREIVELLMKQQERILKFMKSINIKLDKLVNQRTIVEPARKIVETLKDEEKSVEETSGQFDSANRKVGTDSTDSKPSEEVLMDLVDTTVLVITDKAILVTKKGFQKWVPFSTMESGVPIEEGAFLEDIELTEKGQWIHKKGWDKLEVRKR